MQHQRIHTQYLKMLLGNFLYWKEILMGETHRKLYDFTAK